MRAWTPLGRRVRLSGFLLLAASGVTLLFSGQYSIVSDELLDYAYIGMAAMFFLGGLACSLGIIFSRAEGEYIGLPTLASPLIIYGLALLVAEDANPARGTLAFMLIGFGSLFIGEWFSIHRAITRTRTEERRKWTFKHYSQ